MTIMASTTFTENLAKVERMDRAKEKGLNFIHTKMSPMDAVTKRKII